MEHSEVDYIVNQFGPINENIDESLLDNILEEISIIDDESFLKEIGFASIEMGKPQILEYLLENNEFNRSDIKEFKKHVEEYVKHEEETGNLDPEIVELFEKYIRKQEDPRKMIWRRN